MCAVLVESPVCAYMCVWTCLIMCVCGGRGCLLFQPLLHRWEKGFYAGAVLVENPVCEKIVCVGVCECVHLWRERQSTHRTAVASLCRSTWSRYLCWEKGFYVAERKASTWARYLCRNVCLFVCMHVCIFIDVFVCMIVCVCICMSVRKSVCLFVCMYTCLHVCMYARICTYVCMYVRMYTHIYVHICTYARIYVYTYIYIYKYNPHIHIHTNTVRCWSRTLIAGEQKKNSVSARSSWRALCVCVCVCVCDWVNECVCVWEERLFALRFTVL